jgi:hypothetical protein
MVGEKFTGVWIVVFSCTRPCWVWGVTTVHIQSYSNHHIDVDVIHEDGLC